MFCLRRAIERLAGFVGSLQCGLGFLYGACGGPCMITGGLVTNVSSASAIRSNACTILSSRSATFLIGFGWSMGRILTLGTSKNNSPFYVCLAGGNA